MKQEQETLTPLADHIVVRPDKAPNVSKGGIHLPDSATEKRASRGVVVAVGPGERRFHEGKLLMTIPPDVSVGQTIAFAQYAGNSIEMNDEKLLVMRPGDVLGIVT